jgi:DNA-binding NarL/FixJ family response regulator
MTGSSVAALLPAWQEALDADLLRAGDGTLHFRHELLRRAVAASLPAALRNALAREREQVPAAPSVRSPAVPVGRLTAREQTVLALVARGRSNQQIARSLDISSHAVKRHVSSLLVKLDCTNRTEVAILASDVLQPGQPGDRGRP